MAISKHLTIGKGSEGRCTIHGRTPLEKWRRMQDVMQEMVGHLKEAIKILQNENASIEAPRRTPCPPPLHSPLQVTETQRKASLKKTLNKLGRALNQISTLEIYTADLNEEMLSLQKKLVESERVQMDASEQMKKSTSKMQEKLEHYKAKMQETVDQLQHEETQMAIIVKELEAVKKDKYVAKQQLQLQGFGQEHDPLNLIAQRSDLRVENENLKKQITAFKTREPLAVSSDATMKTIAIAAANADRYKEVVAKVTADNMVFLMKLKQSETSLNSAQEKLGELQKEIDCGRAQWLKEASAEIEEVIRSSLSKAESCEAKLQMLQKQQAAIDKEWEQKLILANEKLAHVIASRDWLEKNLMEATQRYKVLDDKRCNLLQRYETENQHRHHAEAESRALVSTLQKTNEKLAAVNVALEASIKDTQVYKDSALEKDDERKKIMADLDKAHSQLETQQAINISLMKKKEEVEWELMEVQAHRARLLKRNERSS